MPRGAGKRPNILLVAVDSLLADHLGCYGYHRPTSPHIDRLAAQGTVFERTYSAHIPTTSAYASMLTGADCFTNQVVALRHQGPMTGAVRTLPEILREAGYDTTCVGFEGNAASRGFDRYLEYPAWGLEGDLRSPKAERLNQVAQPELARLAAGDRPFFLFLRHMDPHSPYLPPAPFDRLFYSGDERDPANHSMDPVWAFKPFTDYFASWLPGVTDKDYVIAQYDGAIAYLDTCLQAILNQLDELKIADETIVVLNGDHGETLYDHECWFDHHGLYDVTLHVPLVVRYSGRVPAGRRIPGYNQHKDLVPTLLDLAGIRVKDCFDGRSLLRLLDGKDASFEPEIYITECTWMRKHGWRTPEWKLIESLEPDFHFKPEVELYNLVTDPGEETNLAGDLPDVVEYLHSRMHAYIARRELETGNTNPIHHQPDWIGRAAEGPFKSSQEAYDKLHLGDVGTAQRLQQKGLAKKGATPKGASPKKAAASKTRTRH
ncbi:MAG: sulfatase [Candidatus Dormibacteria bacterium]